MATLQFVRELKDTKLLLLGIVEEGESARYTVNLTAYRDIGSPTSGDELEDSQLSVIYYTDELIRAKKKALNILTYADNSKKNLSIKLYRAGFSREIIDQVCSDMVERGYVNERRQLERLVWGEANTKLRGPFLIVPKLVSRGYSATEIRDVMDNLVDSGEIDFDLNAEKLIEKKLPAARDDEEIKKLLFKNGFRR